MRLGTAASPRTRTLSQGDLALPRLKPLAQVIALMILAGGAQAAPQAFSSAWFTAKGSAAQSGGAAGAGSAQLPGLPPPLAQQQRANAQLQRSLQSLNNTVAAIAAQQAAQAAGRTAAMAAAQTIHNGLGGNGLNPLLDANGNLQFVNADAPVQTQQGDKTQVSIKQTADKAVLNWETFNIGRDTQLVFQQNADWALLNKVGNSVAPSQIQGSIKADGTVLIINNNGIVFSGSSQINVRNLVAAAANISDEQFTERGLYVDSTGSQPTFTDAAGKVLVEQGALIQTHAPTSSTQGGGYTLLLGKEVENAGTLINYKGQATLAAGDTFYIRKGVSTAGNQYSTTRGNEVATRLNAGSTAGLVRNSGLIQAGQGDITLTGHQVVQAGVAVASSSVDNRGTVHLLNSASDATGSVTLAKGSTTAIVIDAEAGSALDSQRDAVRKDLGGVVNDRTGAFDNLSGVADDRSLSRVEIVSGGTVEFQDGSLTLATGGQVAVSAGQRSLLRAGSVVDVAGAVGVQLAMSSNSIKVNIQGNEQRDASGNRDSGALNSTDVWVDIRDLIYVPAGVNGYASERWYTAGGLLEVGGYLSTRSHSLGEWLAQGGTASFTGGDLVTETGSLINLSGGTVDVQTGYLKQTWLKGADGRLYSLSNAPGDLLYTGVYQGYEVHSERWGQTDYFYNPLIAPRERLENGYTVGRDAGRLVVGTANALLDGDILGETFQGDRQVNTPQGSVDGYRMPHFSQARGAQLIIGNYIPSADGSVLSAAANNLKNVVIGRSSAAEAGQALNAAVSAERQGVLQLDSERLQGFKLGGLHVAAYEGIQVDQALSMVDGAGLTLLGPQVQVNADLTSHGGSITLGNLQAGSQTLRVGNTALNARLDVAAGVTLDASGRRQDGANANLAQVSVWRDGGSVVLQGTGDITLGEGSVINVDAGAAQSPQGQWLGGAGGDITIASIGVGNALGGTLTLGGALHGYGSSGAGTLTLRGDSVSIGAPAATASLNLDAGFFDKGFALYDVAGNRSLEVADGAQVVVSRPVFRLNADATSADQALELWTPPQYLEDAAKGVLTQRQGASLVLQSGTGRVGSSDLGSPLQVGVGSRIEVDDGQSITLRSLAGMLVEGSLIARGGQITLTDRVYESTELSTESGSEPHQRAIRLTSTASLDVSARAVTAVSAQGLRYGQLRDGGSIVIGSGFDPLVGGAIAPDLFVVVENGAQLDASGSHMTIDVPGLGATSIASAGGSISLSSDNGLYIDGSLRAASGGAGAAGGSLSVALESSTRPINATHEQAIRQRELLISDQLRSYDNQTGELEYGHGHLSVAQVRDGAFDSLTLFSRGVISFTESLTLNPARSLNLYAGALGLAEQAAADSQIRLASAHVRLAGYTPLPAPAPGYTNNELELGLSARTDQASLQVDAGLIELRNTLKMGTSSGTRGEDRRGFSTVQLNSSGDVRLLKAVDASETRLSTPGQLNISAAQIYPGTNAVATLQAQHIKLSRSTSATPNQPYSLFGDLTLLADTIDQQGVLRAPMGRLVLGNTATREVTLRPGSLTSVSAAGLYMPYGGTVDGLKYTANGQLLTESVLKASMPEGWLNVTLGGGSIAVEEGAVIDLSGGGEVYGAGFVSGRGGSTDVRYHPLVQNNPDGSFTLPGLASNPVYAIVPGVQASVSPELLAGEGGSQPLVGQQITLNAGVPGLPAGTYTLLPASYALLPGAYRVEVNGLALAGAARNVATAMRNGSWSVTGKRSIAGTGVVDPLAQQLILSSANQVRRYSQYNETSFNQFLINDAARLGIPRAALTTDAKGLTLNLGRNNSDRPTFSMDGVVLNKAQGEGQGSIATVLFSGDLLIHGEQAPTALGTNQLAIAAEALNDLKASSLRVGVAVRRAYGQGGNRLEFTSNANNLVLQSGAELRAGEVILGTGREAGGITVEQGARINTIGQGKPAYDGADGYLYDPLNTSVLVLSNGWVDVAAPSAINGDVTGPGSIVIGECLSQCSGQTELYSEGTVAMATSNRFVLDDQVRFGTRNLTLAVGAINVGSTQSLADAAAAGYLPSGLTLNQQVLDRLLQGDTQYGAPALESLAFNVQQSINFFGSSTLDTLDPLTGKSRLTNLVLGTPAIYGQGSADDVALIRTGNLIWSGATQAAPALLSGGAGTGSGRLQIQAERIELGYAPQSQSSSQLAFDRLALGFANVELLASERLTANHRGSLAVYQSQGEYVTGEGYRYSGGNLLIQAPLVTGEAGSVSQIRAGGTLQVLAAAGQAETPVTLAADALGAELSLSAQQITLDTRVALPSGKLTLDSQGDLLLGDGAQLDMAGRKVSLNDLDKYSWGGDVILRSQHGNVQVAAGSSIDLHADNNQGGSLLVEALDAAAGQVELLGRIQGVSSGHYDAGGTLVPYAGASIDLRAQRLGSGELSEAFAALNQTLNDGNLLGSRHFQFKQGDLTIGDGLRANDVAVSVDNGQLRVEGLIDASGERVGSIRLAAGNGLTLGSTAVLDAHGTQLRVDSYGKIIDSPNRAVVELYSGAGQLTLEGGARIDLRHGTSATRGSAPGQHDGVERGTLALYAPRLLADDPSHGDIAIDASGALSIEGAKRIDLFAMTRDYDAPLGTDSHVSERDYVQIDQAYMDARHAENIVFMEAALQNGALIDGKLAGLTGAYREQFHLRPGVEVITDGDLVVSGDLDLSVYRYASLNPNVHYDDTVSGSGEAGSLSLRAGGDIDVLGSINDGFSTPPDTQDDDGWLLLEGRLAYGTQVVVPNGGVELHAGTGFLAGQVLNYDLPIQARQMAAGAVLPVRATLAAAIDLPAGTVLAAPIYNVDGSLALAAGTRLDAALHLDAGMQLGAGSRLVVNTPLTAMTWPKGVPLPAQPTSLLAPGAEDLVLLSQNLVLQRGAIIPPRTDVNLGGAGSVALRPDGKGRNWAVASMLPAGSESWNLRLVAGADTGAADPRLTDPRSTGTLRLADHHVGLLAEASAGGWVWTQEGLDGFGWPGQVGDPIPFDEIFWDSMCDDMPGWCAKAQAASGWAWTQEGLDGFGWPGQVGDPIPFDEIFWDSMCEDIPSWCMAMTGSGDYEVAPYGTRFSVLRTGTGDLDLVAAGNLDMTTLYGVYTAGTATTVEAAYNLPRGRDALGNVLPQPLGDHEALVNGDGQSLYQAWYPEQGGNLLVNVGGDLTGNSLAPQRNSSELSYQPGTSRVGNWLWRQGSGTALADSDTIATAWWINFGTYAGYDRSNALVGFTGFGTLGGGDVDIRVDGQAGVLDVIGKTSGNDRGQWDDSSRSQGLQVAVGSTGRVAADGSLTLTGGGDLLLKIGGALNPTRAAQGESGDNLLGATAHDLQGTLSNLRGNLQVSAAALGGINREYGIYAQYQDARETRAYQLYESTLAAPYGGLVVVPGDSTVQLSTRGDLVLGAAVDPGRVPTLHTTPFAGQVGGGNSWFSLWTANTAIDLFAAGGDLTVTTQKAEVNGSGPLMGLDSSPTDGRFVYPSILRAVAASGNLYFGKNTVVDGYSLLLAPSANSELQLIAQGSIYAGGYAVSQSGAAQSALATPFNPGFIGSYAGVKVSNQGPDGIAADLDTGRFPLFAFASTSTANAYGQLQPARFYAVTGDLVGVRSGEILDFRTARNGAQWYEGAAPVWMMAGRDIVYSGTALGEIISAPKELSDILTTEPYSSGNLFVHNDATDHSLVVAGRDILFSSFNVAGPGTLTISAGRDLRLEDRASITSLGAVVAGDSRPGASLVLQAGVAASGPDYSRFAALYLDPTNLADSGAPLASQPGKVVKTYAEELRQWLAERYGFEGDSEQARVRFASLPATEQAVFARQVYFAELRAGGLEYNTVGGERQGSYLRGRNAIAALFPERDVAGNPIHYEGDIVMFGGAGVHTRQGGAIQMLTPGGQQVFGVEGEAPASTAGVITQGNGDIQLYAQNSILLGQSRIMTTFGGSILGWSAEGDINAGRGSKTTVVYTPPRRVYDNWGNTSLAPTVPSTGAGIATLAPVAEVPAGNIDLIAPLGTIDAGEAGIRVSGNVNIAALQVVNAANIQVAGDAQGIPVAAAVNTGAITSASAAANSATQAAADAARQQQAAARERQPSIITVQVIGNGEERLLPAKKEASLAPSRYDRQSAVQVLGAGRLDEQARAQLTEEERDNLML